MGRLWTRTDPLLKDKTLMQLPTLKRVYAIHKNGRIAAYASCVSGGSSPLWGVWSTGGKLLRYFASRADVEAAWAKAKFEPTYVAYAEGELFTDRKQALRTLGVSTDAPVLAVTGQDCGEALH